MSGYQSGMLAKSLAGHDQGQLYVIIKVEEEYVYLSDGRLKPIENPKRKNIKHIQVVKIIADELKNIDQGNVKNEDIRKVIRRFKNV